MDEVDARHHDHELIDSLYYNTTVIHYFSFSCITHITKGEGWLSRMVPVLFSYLSPVPLSNKILTSVRMSLQHISSPLIALSPKRFSFTTCSSYYPIFMCDVLLTPARKKNSCICIYALANCILLRYKVSYLCTPSL